MNKRVLSVILTGILSCIFLADCKGTSSNDDLAFRQVLGLPVKHYLKITYNGPTPINTMTDMWLDIENQARDCVQILSEPALLYVYLGNRWTSIPDNIGVSGTIIGPGGTEDRFTSDSINPDYSSIPAEDYPIRMRVAIVGRLCKNDVPRNDKFADYIELIVNNAK